MSPARLRLRRGAWPALPVVATITIALLPARASAAPATQPSAGACQGGPLAVLGCVASPGRLAGTVAQAAGEQVMRGVTGWITDAAAWFLNHIQQLLVGVTGPDLGASWWVDRYRLLLAFAAVIAAATLLLALIDAAVKGSWEQLARALGIDVPAAAVSGAAAPVLVGYLLDVADWLSGRLLSGFGRDSVATLANTASWFTTFGHADAPAMPLFVGALVALLAIVAGVLVTLELLLRANAIYLVTALVPLVYAMRIWPALQPLARRTVEVLAAIILAQPVVALAIAIGAGAGANLGPPGGRDAAQFGRALTGTVMLLLAALAPWAIVQLLPALEAGLAAQRQRAAVGAGPRAMIQTAYVGSYLGRLTQPALRHAATGWGGTGSGSGFGGGWQLARTATAAATGAAGSRQQGTPPRGDAGGSDDPRTVKPEAASPPQARHPGAETGAAAGIAQQLLRARPRRGDRR
jgi:type IV secretion system protein TrbL